MENFEADGHAQLKSLFDETEEDDEFLGFSRTDVHCDKVERTFCLEPVEIENMNHDSNSKTSGYGSGGEDLSSESDSDVLSDSDDEYASKLKREQAMKERRGVLKSLMSDLHNDLVFKQMKLSTPTDLIRKSRTPVKRSTPRRIFVTRSLPPVTRRRAKLGDPNYSPEKEEKENSRSRLLVRFGPKRTFSDDSDDDLCPSPKKRSYSRRSALAQEHVIIPVEDVTEEMLDNIAKYSVGKEYNAIHGTSCHQCRQKTMDTKSCCRNKTCVGVRGQFCGPCLQNRYGESVRDSLLDADWSCPVCRGFCNCSICRNREGKCATGILIGLARHHGYTNVKDYLASLKTEKSFIVEE